MLGIIYSYRKVFGRQEWQTMIVIDNDDVKCVYIIHAGCLLCPTLIYIILERIKKINHNNRNIKDQRKNIALILGSL